MSSRSSPLLSARLGTIFLLAAFLSATLAWAEDKPPGKKAPAKAPEKTYQEKSDYGLIQRRVYDMNHELGLGWAYMPLDPYYKGYGLSLSYTYHFNSFFALELFRVGGLAPFDTSLKTKVLQTVPESAQHFRSISLFENTNVLFRMLYGKQSLLNRAVLHFEMFGSLGGSLLFYTERAIWKGIKNYRFDLGATFGLGFRFWMNPKWSVRVDLQDMISVMEISGASIPLDSNILIGLSIAWNL